MILFANLRASEFRNQLFTETLNYNFNGKRTQAYVILQFKKKEF